jgi:hypothetical protein
MGQPNGNGNCLEMRSGGNEQGKLNDTDCAGFNRYYCERSPPGMKP